MSQSSFLPILVGAISGAVVGVIATTLLAPSQAARAAQPESISRPASVDSPAALAALARLEEENQSLELRIASLESRPLASGYRAAVEGKSDNDLTGVEAMSVAATRLLDPGGIVSQAYYDDFRLASDMYDEEKAKTRAEARQLELETRSEERLTQLAEKLGLNDYQTDQVRGIIYSQDEQRNALFSAMRGEGAVRLPREDIRESMRSIESEANAAMEAVLTPIQFEEYGSSSSGGFGFGGGGRGGNRGGGNNGGGNNGGRGRGDG